MRQRAFAAVVAGILGIAGCVGDNPEATESAESALSCASNALPRVAATASSTQDSTLYPAAYAIDGDPSTRWSSAWSDPQSIVVDMGAPEYLKAVTLLWETASGKHYTVDVSLDATTWATVYTKTNGAEGPVTNAITGLSAVARYVRVSGITRATSYGYSLYEVEVFGDTNPGCASDGGAGGAGEAGVDASGAGQDAASDAGPDATVDAGADGGLDAGFDASVDAGGGAADSGLDASPLDAAAEASADASPDASPDAGIDASPDASTSDGGCGTVGAWQQIWLPQSFLADQKLETSAVAVDPSDDAVYVAAGSYTNGGNSGTGVYRSNDCGNTFQHVDTSSFIAAGDPWAFLVTGPGAVLASVGYGDPGGVFHSLDHGVSWSQINISPWSSTPLAAQAIALSPSGLTAAVTFHDNCSSPFGELCFGISSDGGAYTGVTGPSTGGGWQEAASLSFLDDSTILYLGPDTWTVAVSRDLGATWTNATFGGQNSDIGGQSYGGSTHYGPDGALYLGTQNGIFSSTGATVGGTWAHLANSPNVDVLADDGVYLYASDTWAGNGEYGNGNGQVFWRAPLSNLSAWTNMPSPDSPRGSYEMAYDATHHVLYSANMIGGLWRLVTQ